MRRAGALGLGAVLLLFAWIVWWNFDQIEEDAFIYFRVAAQFVAGHGLAFNAGGVPVECSTNLAWQGVVVLLTLLPGDVVIEAKLAEIALGVAALVLTYLLARRLTGDPLFAVLAPLLLAVSIPFYQWSQRGLGTPLYLCTLLLTAWFLGSSRLRPWWYLPAFGAILNRPEALFGIAGLLLVLFVVDRKEARSLLRGTVALVALSAALLAFRLLYFHDFLSHPFYVKFRGDTGLGVGALGLFVVSSYIPWILVPALAACFHPAVRRAWSWDVGVVVVLLVLTAAWAPLGEDWKPYNRHVAPALPFLFVFAVFGIHRALSRPALRRSAAAYLLILSTVMLFDARAVYAFSETWDNPITSRDPDAPPARWPDRTPTLDRMGDNFHATIGKFLAANYPAGITVVYDQMGQTPWYAGLDKTFIDMLGLTDRRIGHAVFAKRARGGGLLDRYRRFADAVLGFLWPDELRTMTRAQLFEYVFDQEPELILLHQAFLQDRSTVHFQLRHTDRFAGRYRPAFRLNGAVVVFEHWGVECVSPTVVPEACDVEPLGG